LAAAHAALEDSEPEFDIDHMDASFSSIPSFSTDIPFLVKKATSKEPKATLTRIHN
jgi:hypothetical protein